jgi:transcriptional regulator with XRE-family HTH domain
VAGPPPEARLLRRGRDALGWSIRKAAKRADVSEGSWRLYEGARKVQRMPGMLARMAQAVSVTAEQLAGADRGDAADQLTHLPPLPPDPEDQTQMLQDALARLEQLENELRAIKRDGAHTEEGEPPDARAAG